MTGRTENFLVLADIELFEFVAGRTKILAGVEFFGLFVEDLADGSGHGKTAVGVDVDFANRTLGSFAEPRR